MLQRKQTLYFLAAIILIVIALCIPIGTFQSRGLGGEAVLFNLGIRDGNGVLSFSNWMLFAFMSLSCVLALTAVFLYHRRSLQAKLCSWSIVFLLAWYVFLAFCLFDTYVQRGTFHMSFGLFMPAIALICIWMGRRGVISDEKLIKSANRIR